MTQLTDNDDPFIKKEKFDLETANSNLATQQPPATSHSVLLKIRKRRRRVSARLNFRTKETNNVSTNITVSDQISETRLSKFQKFVNRMKGLKPKKHQKQHEDIDDFPKPNIRRTMSTPRIPKSARTLHGRLSHSIGRKWERIFQSTTPMMDINSPFFPISPGLIPGSAHLNLDNHLLSTSINKNKSKNNNGIDPGDESEIGASCFVAQPIVSKHRCSSLLSFWNGSFFNDDAVRTIKVYSQSQITDSATITSVAVGE